MARDLHQVRNELAMRVYGKHFLDLDTEERNRIKAATHAYAYGMSWEEYQRLRNPDKEGSNGSQ